MTSRVIEVEVNDHTYQVTVERDIVDPHRLQVSWGDTAYCVDARQVTPQAFSLVAVGEASRSLTALVVETDHRGVLDVQIADTTVRVLVDRRRQYSGSQTGGDDSHATRDIVAPMPGKVVRLLVTQGDDVEAGQGVAVVEAMKMENELTAKRDGRVTQILVAEGESVEAGKVMVVIE